jgi:hypothetical protein
VVSIAEEAEAMHRRSNPISETEKSRRSRQREQQLAAVETLLYTRIQTAKVLNCSLATVIRLENAGLLDKVKLAGSRNGKVYHRASQVHALAAARGVKD